jgi:arginine decarboxylase
MLPDSGCRPQWVLPWVVDEWDMAHNVDPSELENAFKKAAAANRPAAAALIVSPTYFGVVSDIAGPFCVAFVTFNYLGLLTH